MTLEETIAERIDGGKIGAAQLRIFLLCLFLAIIDGYDLASMGLAVPLVAKDWNIETGAFGPALAAVMVGVAAGSISLAWLGDRIGRKPVLILSTLGIGLFTFATTAVSDLTLLTLCRFLLGMCFGAGLPNMYSIIADIVPSRNRLFCMTLLTSGASVGGILGGVAAPALSARYGWQGIFIPGGIIPLVIALAMFLILEESPRVLAARGRLGELATTLQRFGLKGTELPERGQAAKQNGPRPTALLKDGLWKVTLFYLAGWIGSGFVFALLAQWLPTLMTDAGWESGAAQRSVIFIYGGSLFGGLGLSWIMDRWRRGGAFVPALAFGLGTLMLAAFGLWLSSPAILVALAGVGLLIGGVQYLQPSLAAYVLPLNLLTLAYSWIAALSRIGAIGGPLLVGWLMLNGWDGTGILMVYSLIGLCSAAAFAVMALSVQRRKRAELLRDNAPAQTPSAAEAVAH